MSWSVRYTKEARKDLSGFDGPVKAGIVKAIVKVSANPLPVHEGGYGKPLGNKGGTDLTGLLKIKLLEIGVRVVYAVKREKQRMIVTVISVRRENEVYQLAEKRKKEYLQRKTSGDARKR